MNREIRVFDSHEAARAAELAEWAAMSKEERLQIGAELHSFWARNYLDILSYIPRVAFNAAWTRRTSVTLDGLQIPLISVEDLIANKIAAGRLQDLADVEALESVRNR